MGRFVAIGAAPLASAGVAPGVSGRRSVNIGTSERPIRTVSARGKNLSESEAPETAEVLRSRWPKYYTNPDPLDVDEELSYRVTMRRRFGVS